MQLPQGMWDCSSSIRGQTLVSYTARWILNHWTTREIPRSFLKKHFGFVMISNLQKSWNSICWCLVSKSCPIPLQPHGLQPTSFLCSWDSPGKNSGVGSYALLPGIFLTQRSNPGLLDWQVDSLPLSHVGSPPCILSQAKWSLPAQWFKGHLCRERKRK